MSKLKQILLHLSRGLSHRKVAVLLKVSREPTFNAVLGQWASHNNIGLLASR